MKPKFHIFRKIPGSSLTWLERVEDIDEAKKRLVSMASTEPGDYVIWDSWGHRFIELSDEVS